MCGRGIAQAFFLIVLGVVDILSLWPSKVLAAGTPIPDSQSSPDDSQGLVVRTFKIKPDPPRVHHAIKLLSPPHKCTMSTGVVTFEWEPPKKKVKNLILEIENVETGKLVTLKARKKSKRHYVNEGKYRWRVRDDKKKDIDSPWRLFKSIELEARGVSSVDSDKMLREARVLSIDPSDPNDPNDQEQ